MNSHWYTRRISTLFPSIRGKLTLGVASLGVGGALLLSQQGSALADGPYTGYFTVTPQQHTQSWNSQSHMYERHQNNDRDWDDDWRRGNGYWGNDGFWHSNHAYRNSPVIYTHNQPRWDPHQRCWVVYNHYNQPAYYTHQAPMYRQNTGLYVVVSVSVTPGYRGYGY